MNKLIAVTAGLLLSTSVFASTQTLHSNTSGAASGYESQAEAIDAGRALAQNLESMSQNELRFELPVSSYQNVKNINVDNTEIKVQEFAKVRGEMKYRAVVDVNYSFDAQAD